MALDTFVEGKTEPWKTLLTHILANAMGGGDGFTHIRLGRRRRL